MVSVLRSILAIFVTAEFISGNFANVFIALVNCIDWVKRRRISSIDRILIALALSRIGLLWISFKGFTLFSPALNIELIFHFSWIIINDFTTWISTSLSLFYLLKIANFSNLLFLHLKKRVNSVIILTLWGGLVFLVFRLLMTCVYHAKGLQKHEGNVTRKTEQGNAIMSALILTYFIPIVISIICFLLLIYSLHRHLGQMRQYSNGSQDPSTKVHVKALKTMVSYLLLFTMYSLSVPVSGWSWKFSQNASVFLLPQTLGILYPSVHSWVLIWGNRKLKQVFVLHVWQARCCCKKRHLQVLVKQDDAV